MGPGGVYNLSVANRGGKYLVNDEHRFVYFIVQKAACTSVKTALLPLFGLEGVNPARGDETSDVHALLSTQRHQVNKRRFLRERERGLHEGYFGFAFVRNPWDRLLSCYRQKLSASATATGSKWRREEYAGGVELYSGMPFAEFVEAVRDIPDEEANPHFRGQAITLLSPDGSLMPDFVGRFESLERDFSTVAERLGAPELRLPHLNRSGREAPRGYADAYDDRLARIVRDRYEADADLFGYSF